MDRFEAAKKAAQMGKNIKQGCKFYRFTDGESLYSIGVTQWRLWTIFSVRGNSVTEYYDLPCEADCPEANSFKNAQELAGYIAGFLPDIKYFPLKE